MTAALPVRRIAIFRALQLGDLLVAVPALRAIRAGFPDAEVTLIGLPWAASFVAHLHNYVDRFVPFEGWEGIQEVPYDPARSAAFVAAQHAYGYDLVIQMHGSGGQSNPFALALGARMTAGYYESPLPPVGLHPAAPYPHDQPEVIRNLNLALLLGCPDRGTALGFSLSEADHAEAIALLGPLAERAPGPLIGIHAGARPPSRRWPAERFAAVADSLARSASARIVLTGGPDDVETAAAVEGRMATQPLNVAGRTTLGGLAALAQRFDLFIANDTGPAHLAEAVGTPTVRLFGPADPCRWSPLDSSRHVVVRHFVMCSPCGHWDCPIDHRCLRRIEPHTVVEAAFSLLTRPDFDGSRQRGAPHGARWRPSDDDPLGSVPCHDPSGSGVHHRLSPNPSGSGVHHALSHDSSGSGLYRAPAGAGTQEEGLCGA